MDATFDRELAFLTQRLGAIVQEQAGLRVARRFERLHELAAQVHLRHRSTMIRAKRRLLARLSLGDAYQIAHAFSLFFQLIHVCEERARIRYLDAGPPPPQSFSQTLAEFRQAGVSAEQLQKLLDRLEIQPVLTAHPTEAKRRTTLYQLIRLAKNLADPDEVLESLWQTEEVRQQRVTPINEVQNVLFFFDRVILQSTARFYQQFDSALAKHYPTVRCRHPFLTFASWVGGDRDGNPFVTPEVSTTTVRLHREVALEFYLRELEALLEEITHATPGRSEEEPVSPGETREPFQPYERLRQRLFHARTQLAANAIGPDELLEELREVQAGLQIQGAHRAARGRLARLITDVEVFGFHLAELDIRDHSEKLEHAPEEIRAEFETIAQIQRQYGPQASNRFILSMTHGVDQLLRLREMAAAVGLVEVDFVPLLETIDDLHRGPEFLRGLWSAPAYREHLRRRDCIQEIMLGYSDSNKDGGYFAANWYLDQAQQAIARLADEQGIQIRFFHGKGGSIDRGGGTSYRSLHAQPYAAHDGRLRVTEQGEVISLKYAHPRIAQRNLEQLTVAVLAANAPGSAGVAPPRPEQEQVMHDLARTSLAFYQDLVYRTPEFNEYFWQATPIELIDQLRIGSRPSRRRQTGDIRELRAIPWVFAWAQSRHFLPAWYGVGHSLAEAARGAPHGLAVLQGMYRDWPFFQALLDNVELSLAKTDLYIAGRYASLVESRAAGQLVFGRIAAEYKQTLSMVLRITRRRRLLAHRPITAQSMALRHPYVDPLHYLQIRFLRQWRKRQPGQHSESLRRLLALTVNGIAFGLKGTG